MLDRLDHWRCIAIYSDCYANSFLSAVALTGWVMCRRWRQAVLDDLYQTMESAILTERVVIGDKEP